MRIAKGIVLNSIFILLLILNKEAFSDTIRPNVTINFRQDLADVDYFNATFAAISNSYAAFDLICTAPYPVDWTLYYDKDDDGTSEQQKEAMSQRFVSNFSDPNTYNYVANISLRYNGKIFVFTSFSCRSTKDVELQTNVILTPKERKNVIFMNITPEPIKIQDNPAPFHNGSCEATAIVSDLANPSSCWKCEKQDGTDLQLDFIGCNNPTECASIYERHNMGRKCLKILPNAVDDKTYSCRRIGAIDYNPKTLVCKNYGPVLTQLYFFGVSKIPNTPPKMYFDWSEVNPQEMIYIHDLPKHLYFGQDLTVTCEMSRYYFSYGSWFGLQFGNNISFYQMGDHIEDESRGTFISNFLLNLTNPSPTKFYCFAPVWNTSEWINASVTFNVKNGEPPSVLSVVADTSSKEFAVGQNNRSLTCIFDGDPRPNITWEGPKIGFFQVLEDGDNYSKVQIYPEYPGQYTCRAKSFLGVDSKSFNVTTSELSSKAVKTILSVSGFLGVTLAISVAYIVFRLCRVIRYQREALRLLTEAEIKEFVEGNPGFVAKNAYFDSNVVIEALPYDKRYEVAPQNLIIDKQNLLGSGAFGKVYKGKIKRRNTIPKASTESEPQPEEIQQQPQPKDEVVAIKTCGGDVDVMFFKALLSEVKIMAFIGHHKNVVSLIGACTQNIRNREVYIAVEFCPNGSLESFLKRHRNSFHNKVQYGMIVVDAIAKIDPGYVHVVYNNIQLTEISDIQLSTKDLLKWTNDVACGLEFLHEKKVIHADLAVRNILLTEDLIAKIGDFGLARQLVECSNYVKKTQSPLPWRHLAPESLRNLEFSLKSDVWSLAVAIWEIFTLSETPYAGTSFNTEFILQLEHGMRLTKPIFATNNLYEFMLKCWTFNPDDRPGDLEELKDLCTKSLRLFVEHETADDNEYLKVCGVDEVDLGDTSYENTEMILNQSTS